MRPEAAAQRILSTTRATAKMHEFRVAPGDFIALPQDPALLFSLAVGLLGDVAAYVAQSFTEPAAVAPQAIPQSWDGTITPQDALVFAATFFESYLEARLDQDITTEFSLLCAGAYYLSDAVGSAAVVVRRAAAPEPTLAQGLATLCHAILGNEFGALGLEVPNGARIDALLGSLRRFFALDGNSDDVTAECAKIRRMAYDAGSDRELFYADLVCALCARKIESASRNRLPVASGLQLERWAPALRKPHFPIELWPAQKKICDAGLLSGRSAVIQMPTSAGKTKSTELIIRASFLSGRSSLAVIVAPFRSLCHDIRGDLAKAFSGEQITLDEVSDSYQFDVDLDQLLAQHTVLIVTPEKLLYMLRRAPELAQRIGLIIYDEGHQFDGLTRGPTYELLLSTLRMTLPAHAQVMLISAVIGNAGDIAEWLVRDREAVVTGQGIQATTKTIAFASWRTERGQLQYVSPQDPDESEFYVPRVINALPLGKIGKERKDRFFPDKEGTDWSEAPDIGLYLGLHLVPNGSVAVFCGQKGSVTRLCRRAVDIFTRNVALETPRAISVEDQVAKLHSLIAGHLGPESDVAQAASLGIFGHHSSTPGGVRLSIEHAMKEGDAKFVICTSTLAQGVNFPIRYLIITATQQGAERIKVRDFHNLMGRAGRAGMYTEGTVIFSAPAIYDEKAQAGRQWRWAAARNLLDANQAEPSTSGILSIFDDYEQTVPPIIQRLVPAWLDLAFADRAHIDRIVDQVVAFNRLISASEFRAFASSRARAVQSIASYLSSLVDFESENAMASVETLAQNTLAFHLADAETRVKLVEVFRATARAVMERADPEFRALIRKSPLAPADLSELKVWLDGNLQNLRQAADEDRSVELLMGQVLPLVSAKSISSISDQAVVLPSLERWISGQSYHQILGPLIAADIRISTNNPTVEHVVALCENGFSYDVAMVVASLADLLEPVDAELYAHVSLIQKRIKYGLSEPAAIAFHEAGFADRIVAAALAALFPAVLDRFDARRVCRQFAPAVRAFLSTFPAYFQTVADEIAA